MEQLIRVRHSRRGSVLHEAVTHGCGMAVLNYLMGVVIQYERERVWMGRGGS